MGKCVKMNAFKRNIILVGIFLIVVATVQAADVSEGAIDRRTSATVSPLFEIRDVTNPNVQQTSLVTQLNIVSNPKNNRVKIPATIKKFDVVTFNQPILNDKLKSGEGLTFRIREKEFKTDLTRVNLKNIEDGVETYSGTLVGEKGSKVLITISDDVTVGSITLGTETIWIDPIEPRSGDQMDLSTAHIIYSSQDVDPQEIQIDEEPIFPDLVTEISDIQGDVNAPLTGELNNQQVSVEAALPDQAAVVTVLVVTDEKFYQENANWIAKAQDIITIAQMQLERDDIKVSLQSIYEDSRRMELLNHPLIALKPLTAFEEVYPKSYLNNIKADIALYLGGYDIPGDSMHGSSIVFPDGRYAWAQMAPDEIYPGYSGTLQGRRCITIHELGHIFGANHENSGGFDQAFGWFDLNFPIMHHTVMWHSYIEGINDYEFSSDNYRGDAMHDNARRIQESRNTVADYANNNFKRFTITPSIGQGGHIFPGYNIPIVEGDSFSFTIVSEPGYIIDGIQVDNVRKQEAEGKELYVCTISNIQQNTRIRATFKSRFSTYTITPSAGNHGSIYPSDPITVLQGDQVTFRFTPDASYSIKEVLIDGGLFGPVPAYTFENVQENHKIKVTFEKYFTITPNAGNYGTITPTTKVSVPRGGSQTFTIAPYSGYSIKDVLVDGLTVGPISSYTFTNVQDDHKIKATFETAVFTITPSAGSNGWISPSIPVSVPRWGSQTFYISSNPGYLIKDVAVDGNSAGPLTSYTFTNVQDNHRIKATFKQAKQTFTITPSTGSHGTISPSTPVTVPYAGSRTFTITPDEGYTIDQVYVNGGSVGPLSSYTFTNVQADQTISATFELVSPPTQGTVPLCQAGTPFDSSKYAQNAPNSDPMVFQCYWGGTGQVFISGDKTSLTGVHADDGFTIAIQPSGASFDAPEHWAHQHPVVELTSGMRPGLNTLTLVVQNWMGLSMSYGSSTGIGTDQTPYIIEVNSPIVRVSTAQVSIAEKPFIQNETPEDTNRATSGG